MPDSGKFLFREIGRKIVQNVRHNRQCTNKDDNEKSPKCQSVFFGEAKFRESAYKPSSPKNGKKNNNSDSGYDSGQTCSGSQGSGDDDESSGKTSSSGSVKSNEKSETSGSSGVSSLANALERLRLRIKRAGRRKSPKVSKTILRKPVRHVYVRGISGLPTKRVPVSANYYRQPRSSARYYT